jgi:DNA-directed RNA polymerase subunit RPC12/RpoP
MQDSIEGEKMGTTSKCPHCRKNIFVGEGFCGPDYKDENGRPFEPVKEEKCPECGKKVLKNEWLRSDHFILWD